MIRTGRFLIVAGAITVVGLGVHLLPEAFSRMEFFRVSTVEIEGLRYLERDEALMISVIPADLSVWDDIDAVAARLERHPLVADARARRRLPATLVLQVEERQPVALYPAPTLTPIDRIGTALPIDPAKHRLDLPLLQAASGIDADRSILAREVARIGQLEPRMAASLSEISMDEWGDVVLRLGSPRVSIHYRPPLSPDRLREGIQILTDALAREPDRSLIAVDLRFDDQVVARYSPRPAP